MGKRQPKTALSGLFLYDPRFSMPSKSSKFWTGAVRAGNFTELLRR